MYETVSVFNDDCVCVLALYETVSVFNDDCVHVLALCARLRVSKCHVCALIRRQ